MNKWKSKTLSKARPSSLQAVEDPIGASYGGAKSIVSILFVLTLLVPVLVLPGVLDNAFNAPKNLLMLLGASAILCIYAISFCTGRKIPIPRTETLLVLTLLISLNLFSLFYTDNYYYTAHAAVVNISCLLLFFFVSVYIDRRHSLPLLIIVGASGALVSIETYLEFFNIFILFPWASPGMMIIATIGNPDYLGAYLMFPLLTLASLFFLVKGKWRFITLCLFAFMMGAFLFARARAGWMGFFIAFPFFLILMKWIHQFSLVEYVRSHLKPVAIYGMGTVVLLVVLWAVAPDRFHAMMEFRNVTNPTTVLLRIKKYIPASRWLFEQSPLFGTGLWSYRNMVYEAQAEINKTDPDFFKNYPEPKPRRVHNEYLEILNDGGLVAAGALLLFLVVVMRHGWTVIRNQDIAVRDRCIAAMAFFSVIAVMLNAIFFFPFRLNSTMFMTVLMMGLMEGLYLKHYKLVEGYVGSRTRIIGIFFTVPLLTGLVWFTGLKPFMGEIEHLKYKKALGHRNFLAAKEHLLKAIDYDPRNTLYCMWASHLYFHQMRDLGKADEYITRAIVDFNGDIVPWAAYFMKGMLRFQAGSPIEAKEAFENAVYYNPNYQEAILKLEEVNRVIREHNQVLIKFR